MKKIALLICFLVYMPPTWAKEQSIHDRMTHHRAIEAVVWAMPILTIYRKFSLERTK